MNIPSARTRRDMETAAELRAAGATWETAAVQLGRQPNLLMRWARIYRDEWERLNQEAEEHLSRQAGNESRHVLRTLLRSKSSKIRLTAADKLTRYRLQERAKAAPPNAHVDQSAFLTTLEEMSDADLQKYLADFVQRIHAQGPEPGLANPHGAAGPD